MGVARGRALLRRQGERDVEPVGRQARTSTIGPLDEKDGSFSDIIKSDFGQFGGRRQTVEIGVDKSETRQRISLRERESRARDLDTIVAGEKSDERAGKGRFSGTEISGQRDDVAWFDHGGDVRHQPARTSFVSQGRIEAVDAGHAGEHRIIRCKAATL